MSVLRVVSRIPAPSRTLPGAIRIQSIPKRSYSDHGGAHYNEPSGNIFGEKPPPPGQKRVREDWEMIYYWGMFGSMAFAAVGLYFKPDTSIQTWALNEARNRLEARGENYKYDPAASSPAVTPSEG